MGTNGTHFICCVRLHEGCHGYLLSCQQRVIFTGPERIYVVCRVYAENE